MIADVPPTSPSAILAEERLRVHTERVPVERVVIGKRVVTETRTFTVEVRREELVIERPLALDRNGGTAQRNEEKIFVLHEEVPEITLRAVPVERVRVVVESVTGHVVVEEPLRHEEATVDESIRTPERQ